MSKQQLPGAHVAPTAADSAEWLRVTLSSIGDGVITTDVTGRVTFLNPVASDLTGWTLEQVAQGGGVAIELVFRIVNEETRAEVPNPAMRALREGVTVGLANHTLLIARDGTERPIDDSAAPIRGDGGAIAGAVLVFRDITERRQRDKEVQDAREFAENILETLREPFLVLDKTLRVISASRSFYKAFRVEKAATEGRFVYDLGDGQWNIPKLRELLEDLLARGQAFDGFEVEHDFPSVGRKVMVLNARRMAQRGNPCELLLLAIEDITERRRDEALLVSQDEVLELAAGGAALNDVFELLVRAAQRHAGEDSRATLFILEPDGLHLRWEASAGMSEDYTRAVDHFIVGPRSPSCGTAAFTGQTVIVADIAKDPLWAPYLDLASAHEIKACWSHPFARSAARCSGPSRCTTGRRANLVPVIWRRSSSWATRPRL
jgi:PAS domain S-box-containing protein